MTSYILFLSNSVHKNSVQTVDKGRSKVLTYIYIGQEVNVCDKYLGQRPIKVKRSGMNARRPLLPVTRPDL